jgi:23S rRNA (cytidine1920-2'-O)/16S rRNA (cytidine1409-2'-O)-methyltransferase
VCTVDVSFVSLRTIAPALVACTTPTTTLILLVKPQFEAGRARVGKGGIVRDPAVHRAVLREVVDGLEAAGIGVCALVASPLQGADGNREFFALARHGEATVADDAIDAVVGAAA